MQKTANGRAAQTAAPTRPTRFIETPRPHVIKSGERVDGIRILSLTRRKPAETGDLNKYAPLEEELGMAPPEKPLAGVAPLESTPHGEGPASPAPEEKPAQSPQQEGVRVLSFNRRK